MAEYPRATKIRVNTPASAATACSILQKNAAIARARGNRKLGPQEDAHGVAILRRNCHIGQPATSNSTAAECCTTSTMQHMETTRTVTRTSSKVTKTVIRTSSKVTGRAMQQDERVNAAPSAKNTTLWTRLFLNAHTDKRECFDGFHTVSVRLTPDPSGHHLPAGRGRRAAEHA